MTKHIFVWVLGCEHVIWQTDQASGVGAECMEGHRAVKQQGSCRDSLHVCTMHRQCSAGELRNCGYTGFILVGFDWMNKLRGIE